jgi:hypothetical protein
MWHGDSGCAAPAPGLTLECDTMRREIAVTRKASVPLALAAICVTCLIALTQTTCKSPELANRGGATPATADRSAAATMPVIPATFHGQVEQALQRGQVYLLQKQARDGGWGTHAPATSAMVLYALLDLGMSPQEPNVKQGLAWLNAQQIGDPHILALRARALKLAAPRTCGDGGDLTNPSLMQLYEDLATLKAESRPAPSEDADPLARDLGDIFAEPMPQPATHWRWFLDHQHKDGSWDGTASPAALTAYCIVLLAKDLRQSGDSGTLDVLGQYHLPLKVDASRFAPTLIPIQAGFPQRVFFPTLMQVLRPGSWVKNGQGREVALARMDVTVPLSKWDDSPCVVIVGAVVPEFTSEEIEKLRTYVLRGGTIVSFLQRGSYGRYEAEFDEGMKQIYGKLFPDLTMAPLGIADDLYTTPNRCASGRHVVVMSNGVRPLVIHCGDEALRYWGQPTKVELGRESFLVNVAYLLVGEGEGTPKDRRWPVAESSPAQRGINLARLKYAGNYDPEPLALERFSLLMARDCSFKISFAGPTEASKLTNDCQLAAMTGTAAFTLPQADKDALKKYVQGGGTLIIDAAGGSQEFFDSAQTLVEEIWGRKNLQILPKDAALYVPPGDNGLAIEKFAYNFREQGRYGQTLNPHLKAVMIGARPAVILSKEDITAGLLGITPRTVDGYMPKTAYEIMRNLAISVCK